jgi:hypothetical protein
MLASVIALAFAFPAVACQPPRDMPVGALEQQEYWDRARVRWDTHVVATASTLQVARISLPATVSHSPPDEGVSALLTPIRVLRGPSVSNSIGVNARQWCADFPVSVRDKGIYLLAMSGNWIKLAIPLVEGQEQEGVRDFFARIGEPVIWN